jgi:hypothetical protein
VPTQGACKVGEPCTYVEDIEAPKPPGAPPGGNCWQPVPGACVLPEAGVPFNTPPGRIVSWRLTAGTAGAKVALRVLHPDFNGAVDTYTAIGTSATETTSVGLNNFATSLPFQGGDTIGLDDSSGGLFFAKGPPYVQLGYWPSPGLAEGTTMRATRFGSPNLLLLVSAEVVFSPPGSGPGPEGAGSGPGGSGTHCVVPKIVGKTLARAKQLLRRAHCALGKVTAPKGSRGAKMLVRGSSPRAGTRLRSGAKVEVRLRKA